MFGWNWAVVQCAEADLGEVGRPDVPESQEILRIKRHSEPLFEDYSIGVLGRKAVETDAVVYLSDNIFDLPEINKELGNYVLIVPKLVMGELRQFEFADYSNAAAIICSPDTYRGAGTHLNGAVREAGIIVLAGGVDREFLEGLEPGVPAKKKLLVYANDALEEAFVATMD